MKRPYKKLISVLLTAAMLNLCWLTSYGWAEMVSTRETPPQITREMLIDALNRKDVQGQLEQYGISQVEAVVRINSLTDEEISAYWVKMVETHEIPHQITREMLIDALNREDVQKQLEQYGISKVEAVVRINSLTDEEISALVKEMDDLPAGGQAEAAIAEGTIFGILIAVVLAFLAVILVIYFLKALYKGTECIFSDCEAKGGWKDTGNSSIKTDDGDYQENGHPENTFPTDDLKNEDCDPRMESCERTVR